MCLSLKYNSILSISKTKIYIVIKLIKEKNNMLKIRSIIYIDANNLKLEIPKILYSINFWFP